MAAISLHAHADKVYFKNGKVLDGVVQKEFDTRIELLYQGRTMTIFRDRIDRIEKESGGQNLKKLLDEAEEAIKKGNAAEAETPLKKVGTMEPPQGDDAKRLANLQEQLRKLKAMGSPEERRKTAEGLLKEAIQNFDRVENQKGTELLLRALEADPSYDAAHDEMAKFMKRAGTVNLSMATEYFCERVDPDKIKADHPIINLLPQIYEEEIKKSKSVTDAAEIQVHTQRLQKLSAAFDKHPQWVEKATDAQKNLIGQKSSGVAQSQIEQSLAKANFQDAMTRLQVLGGENDSPDLKKLYIRTWVGMKQFDKAKKALEDEKKTAADPALIDKTLNALDLYATAVQAMEAQNHRDARAVLGRLYGLREDLGKLLPEINALVAEAKSGYDISEMENLEADKPTDSANLAAQIYDYSTDKTNLKKAEETFAHTAPQIAYKANLAWVIDDAEIPILPDWIALGKHALTTRFKLLKLDDASPFTLTVKIIQGTHNQGGSRIAESTDAKKHPDPLNIDYIEPDSSVTSMKVALIVSHATNANLSTQEQAFTALPQEVVAERDAAGDTRHREGRIIYLDITQLKDMQTFLEKQLARYLPPDAEKIGTRLKLKPKS